ncbi:DUF2188 domain-containing protein [Microbacterium sp. TPD7012]|uniref:DUF2188 domain-containing protein n=1 Tax=Microbacterium sp. TPD7012 TaxID=2171975 RepID=UPI000D5060AC|nr:DUF2188 domain-containing protein [Microbacterium sp. TPD7012]PVE94973.1 hypothetical protein DC434_13690 [Microbacterium sp. TPD7012]
MPVGDVETLHRDGIWFNQITGHARIQGDHRTKAEAVEVGRSLAHALQVAHIVRDETGHVPEPRN